MPPWDKYASAGPWDKYASAPVAAEVPAATEGGQGSWRDDALAATGGLIEGLPIVGGPMRAGMDKAAALKRSYLNGTSYEDELKFVTEDAQRIKTENPIIDTAANLTGAVAGIVPAAGTALGAKALGLVGKNLLTRTAASTASGAAIGGADAATRGQDIKSGAETGAIFGLASPVAGKVIGATGRALLGKNPAKAVPSMQSIKTEGGAKIEAAKQSGLAIKPKSMNRLALNMVTKAKSEGIDPTLHPDSWAALNRVAQAKEGELPLVEVMTLRKILNAAGGAVKPEDQKMALMLKDMMDEHLDRVSLSEVAGVNSKKALDEWHEGRKLWHRARKAEDIEWAIERAKNAASGFENGLRSEFRSIANSKRKMARYTAEEQEIIKDIVRGTKMQNLMQKIGRSSLMNGILMPVLMGGGGGMVGGVPGMVAGLAVPGAIRAGITAKTASKATNLGATARNGGPLPTVPRGAIDPATQLLIQGYGTSR